MLGHKFQGKSITDDSRFTMDEITINLQKKCEEKPHPAMVEECKLISINSLSMNVIDRFLFS